MTAQHFSPSIATPDGRSFGRMAGFRPLVRKDLTDMVHGPRAWVILALATAFMALTTANAWINAWVVANIPGAEVPDRPLSMAPLDNLVAAASTQVFVIAAIFAAMALLVAERDRGTLAWVASKPVARGAIWSAKWSAATAVIWVVAGLLPLVASVGVAIVLYGVPSVVPVAVIAVGMAAAVAFYVAVILAASTVVSSQSAVAAIGFAVLVVPPILGALVPFDIAPFLPTSIISWSLGVAMGADVGLITPAIWAIAVVALVLVSIQRMDGLEL